MTMTTMMKKLASNARNVHNVFCSPDTHTHTQFYFIAVEQKKFNGKY